MPLIARFGEFELDSAHRALRRNGECIPITAKVFDTLVVLVNHRDRVMEKAELLRLIWPDCVVEEGTLFQTVSMLRKTIGCSRGDGPRYISTISGRGYQFVADVEFLTTPPVAASPAAVIRPPLGQEWPRSRWPVILLVVAAAVLTGWFVRLKSHAASATTFQRPEPLTSYPGREVFPAFSPGGDRVAFMWEGAGRDNWDIYVKLIGKDSPQRLTQHPAADWSPAWSPDGKTIAFVRRNFDARTNELIVMPASGGPERTLLTGALIRTVSVWNQLCRLVAWHPDGEHLIVSHADEPGQPSFLYAVSARTGHKKRLTYWPGRIDGDMDPAVSHDGRRLAFRRKVEGWNSDVYTVPLTASLDVVGQPTLVGPRMFSPAFTRDGRELVMVSSPARPGLWRVSAMGNGEIGPTRVEQPSEAGFPAISAAGDRAAFSVVHVRGDIWQASLDGNPQPRPLIVSTYLDLVPDYSPDGTSIAFTSYRSGNQEIWVCNRDGSDPVQLTHHRSVDADCPAWSPDGSTIAYHANQDGYRDVFVVNADGGPPRRLTNRVGLDVPPSWSRDGQWIYFASDRSGERSVWKVAAQGGEPVRVTAGTHAQESVDGERLFVDDGKFLWSVPSSGPASPRIRLLERFWANANFRVRDKGIYLLGNRALSFYDFRSKAVMKMFETPHPTSWGLSVSSDGKSVLFAQIAPEESDIMMMNEFR